LESVKGKIQTTLQQKALTDYMQGLRDSSKLVFNEKNAKPTPDAKPDASMSSSQQSETATQESNSEAAGKATESAEQK
jgi:hypothetical protein